MNKRIKSIITTLVIAAACSFPMAVSADTISDAQGYLNQALSEKTFYKYNVAYEAILKIEDNNLKNQLLNKLATIANEVNTDDVKKINSMLNELVNTQGSGDIYDQVQAKIQSSSLKNEDKSYLMQEVSSWGKKLVYTDDYSEGVGKVVEAWGALNSNNTTKADEAIKNSRTSISSVKNSYSKKYLENQLQQVINKRVVNEFIQAGKVTESQGTAVLSALNSANGDSSQIKKQLDALVSDKTITQEQANAIFSVLNSYNSDNSNSSSSNNENSFKDQNNNSRPNNGGAGGR